MKYWITSKINLTTIDAPEEGDIAVLVHVASPKVYVYEDEEWGRAIEEIEDEILDELNALDQAYNSRFDNPDPDGHYYYSTRITEKARRNG